MIRSQIVTSKHVELSANNRNYYFLFSLYRLVERSTNGFIHVVKQSFVQAFFYIHLLYNVCYNSMAKSESNPESENPETSLTKCLLVSENFSGNLDVVPSSSAHDAKSNCCHVNKAIDLTALRKIYHHNYKFLPLKCHTCSKFHASDSIEEVFDELLVCMQCGACCCTDHIQQHFEKPRSDLHVLYINNSDWSVNCLNCQTDIPIDMNGRLKQGVLMVKKSQCNNKPTNSTVIKSELDSLHRATAAESALIFRNSDSVSPSTSSSVTYSSKSSSSLMPPRGLSNLGNTCFFNSVLQNLARTPFLLNNLRELQESGENVTLGVENGSSITFTLNERWGPVTEALVGTLVHITQQSNGSYPPGHLLDALRKKHLQFMGYNQHDAHELLRTLLDCVKTEDIKRYLVEILRFYGLSRKTNPDEVDEKKRTSFKELNKKLTELVNIRPDPVFKGITVSANQCTKCHHKSEIPESFLDLSLPVSFLKLQPLTITHRKSEFGEKPKSKHQLKKEKKAARKNIKLAKMKKRFEESGHMNDRVTNYQNSLVEMVDIIESGYSGKASSPVQIPPNQMTNENKDEMLAEALNEIKSAFSNTISEDSVVKVDSNISSPSESFFDEAAASVSSVKCRITEPMDGGSENLPVLVQNQCEMESDNDHSFDMINNRLGSTSSVKINNPVSSESEDDNDDAVDGEYDTGDSAESEDVSVEDCVLDATEVKIPGLCATLQPSSEDEDNSILACLREYTKCEILTGNNKVNCEKCTKEHLANTGEKKQIYRTFTKQLLIKSPPPVLILHLKRFEMKGAFSFGKVEKFISFPLILDVGSFCSSTCERLLYPEQKNIIYSLYGIVEHSGSLNAGHYVAYVKVRKLADKNSYSRLFLPKNMQADVNETYSGADFERILSEHMNADHQWYYISDSSVRAVAEEDVLRKQAYLLFYERIW